MLSRIICAIAFIAMSTCLPKRVFAQPQIIHLSISNRYLAKAGSNIIISQTLLDPLKNPTQFFSEDIEYDKNVVEFIDVTNGAQTPGPDWTISKTVTTPGDVRISAVSIGSPLVDSGEILKLIFHVVDTALAFESTPFRDSAPNFGLGTRAISDTGRLHVYDECTPILGLHRLPLSISTYCSPSPASSVLHVSYSLPDSSAIVNVELFDRLGTCVRRGVPKSEGAGWHSTSLDISDLPDGAYYYAVKAGNSTQFHPVLVSH